MQLGPLFADNSGTLGPPLFERAHDDQQSERHSQSVAVRRINSVQERRFGQSGRQVGQQVEHE